MKIIAISDLHLTLKESYGVTTSDGLNSRVKDKLSALSKAVDYAVNNNANLFIDAGDTFDILNPPELLRYKFIEAITPLFRNNIPIIIIMGNHVYNATYYNLQSEELLLKYISDSKMEIISKPVTRKINNISFTFMPWNYIDEAEKYFKEHPNTIVFHHLPIKNAILNSYEVKSKEGLDDSTLKSQAFFIGGHYHMHQVNDNYCYIGSLVKQDFGEREQKKGFIELNVKEDLTSLDLNFIEIKDRDFIQLDFIEPTDPIDYLKSVDTFKESIIKSSFTGSKQWLYNINKTEYLKTLELKGAMRVLQPEYIDSEEPIKKSNTLSSSGSFEEHIQYYCKEKNRTDCEELMLNILKEVQNTRKII